MSNLFSRPRIQHWWLFGSAIMLMAGLLMTPGVASAQQGDDPSPHECSACHREVYREWQESPHANSLTDPAYLEAWDRAGQPEYCKTCHASGYNPRDGSVSYEGVACLSCHIDEDGDHIDGGDIVTDESSELCGECHTGPHAPDYEQWLMSEHATMNIDCGDCHQSHSHSLRIEDANELCLSCHEMDSEDIHGEAGMDCTDCHMASNGEGATDVLSGRESGPGHSFGISPDVCSSCHGMTHTIKPDGTEVSSNGEAEEVEALTEEVEALETEAQQRFDLGLTGGGIGGLALGITIPWLLRKRREK